MGQETVAVNTIKVLYFLKQFTAGMTGYLQVETISPVMVEDGKAITQRKTVALDNIDALASFIEQHKEWNLYFRPNLLKNSEGSGKGGSTLKTDIIAGMCFHVDLDPKPLSKADQASMTPDTKRAYLEAERQRIKLELVGFKVPPSFVIDSGGGYQAFWRLAVPVSIEEAEAINQQLCAYFDTPDSCHSIQHLMRLPYTTNWPGFKKLANGRSIVPTKLLVKNDKRYTLDDFAFLPPAKASTKVKAGTKVAPDSTGLPARFIELLAVDEDLQKRWEGDTEGLADPSASGLDMSITARAVKYGFNNAEIADILRAFPHGKAAREGRDDDYIDPMLAKTRQGRTLSPTQPLLTAHRYTAEKFTAEDGTRLVRYWNDEFYAWQDGVYKVRSDKDIEAAIWHYLGAAKQFIPTKAPTANSKAAPTVPAPVAKGKSVPFAPNRAKVGEVLAALRATALLQSDAQNPSWLDGADLGAPDDFLIMANGILHMPTRNLREHNPRLFSSMALTFAYKPQAAKPVKWLTFLNQLWPDDVESIETLQEYFGYCLTSDISQQKILMIIGPKRAGKGVIAKILRALVGGMNYTSPTLDSLARPFGMESLINKSLAIFSDVRLSGHADQKCLTGNLLTWSGGDTMSIPRKYKQDWIGTLRARALLLSNEMPKILDDSGALSSRFIILQLMKSFLGEEDTGLYERLLEELPAILNWSLDGLERLKDRGYFCQPASALELVEEMENLTSPIGAFIRDKCVVSPGAEVDSDLLYSVWEMHRRAEGWNFGETKPSFGASLRAAVPGLKKKHLGPRGKQTLFYIGVGLATGHATVADLQAKTAEIVDLDAVRAKNRELLL